MVCAVSGGPDSTALLVLATMAELVVTAVHVDHGLRPGSAAEADVVATTANRFGAAFRAEKVAVEPGPNLEARARLARRTVLPADALTGHTADDLAETMLLNLIRGAGLRGLSAMSPATRPMLGLRRTETHRLCHELGIVTVNDPSNSDPTIRRNRVRHELLPILDDIAERDVAAVLARQVPLLGDDDQLLDSLAAELDPTDARSIASAPASLARRAVRAWLIDNAGNDELHPPSAAEVERVLSVARGEQRACEIEGGWRVSRHRQRLKIGR